MRYLKRIESRGYDSAGFSAPGQKVERACAPHPIEQLLERPFQATTSVITHTRWATHGSVDLANAHPHESGSIRVVHNGVITNYELLCPSFPVTCDTAVVVKYLDERQSKGMGEALTEFNTVAEGTWAIVLQHSADPGHIYFTVHLTPLMLQDNFLSSEVHGLPNPSGVFHVIPDKGVFRLSCEGVEIFFSGKWQAWESDTDLSYTGQPVPLSVLSVLPVQSPLPFPLSFTETEIREQAHFVLPQFPVSFPTQPNLLLIGCGSSYFVAQICASVLNRNGGVRAHALDGSNELSIPESPETAVIAFSQSGETMDLITLVRNCNLPVYSMTNAPWSTLGRMSPYHVWLRVGQEVGVASTKAMTASIRCFLAWAGTQDTTQNVVIDVERIWDKTLTWSRSIFRNDNYKRGMFILGSGTRYFVAKEIALKFKELCRLHVEPYKLRGLKHGPLAVVHEGDPVVVLLGPEDKLGLSAVNQLKARKAIVFVVGCTVEGTHSFVNQVDGLYSPVLDIIVGQCLSLHLCTLLGLDADKPQNIAKTITVL